MNTIELTIEEYQRLMDSILWILGPFWDDELDQMMVKNPANAFAVRVRKAK